MEFPVFIKHFIYKIKSMLQHSGTETWPDCYQTNIRTNLTLTIMCQKYIADLKKCQTAPQSFSVLQHSELHIFPGTDDAIS